MLSDSLKKENRVQISVIRKIDPKEQILNFNIANPLHYSKTTSFKKVTI